MMKKRDYQLVIIGAGSGGLAMAEIVHALGLKRVALIEKNDRLGGECLHTGCVPSKALIHAAKRGVKDPWAHVRASIDAIEQRSDNDEHIKKLGIDLYHGAASFVDDHHITVNHQRIHSKFFLLTTGSQPFVPDVPGLETVKYHTNETIFSLVHTPKRLAILGSGPIGVEMATAFSALGSDVHIFERGPRILSRIDEMAAQTVSESLKKAGVSIHTNTAVRSVAKDKKHIVLTTDSNQIFHYDELLVAVGRVPNTNGLNLEAAGIAYDKRGITIDSKLRTSKKHIYAVGDVTPSPKFTHLAAHQASVALRNMLSPTIKFSAKRLVPTPAITYSTPEVGSFGISEEEALKKKGSVRILHHLDEVDRAVTDDATNGFVKLVVTKWGRILHCTVVAQNASELLTPLLILYTRKRSIIELAYVVIPYPTVASILTNITSDFSSKFARNSPGWELLSRKWR